MQAEHDDLKAEIETREKTFSSVVALGEAMVKEDHSAAKEVPVQNLDNEMRFLPKSKWSQQVPRVNSVREK